MSDKDGNRGIRAYVPGKQVTIAHLIPHPSPLVCDALGLEDVGAIGVLTLTPGETSIIAGDIAVKAADVGIGFLDRFSGTLILHGSVGDVEQALRSVLSMLESMLDYGGCHLTRH